MMKADVEQMSEDEDGMIVALSHGSEPRLDDPVCKALEARGLARSAGSSWELTRLGAEYLSKLS
jgi:hypothetical protein